MSALNTKYAGGYKESFGLSIPGVAVTQPGLYNMANRISKANAKTLGWIGILFSPIAHGLWATATEEGQERRDLAAGYAYDMQRCDPTR